MPVDLAQNGDIIFGEFDVGRFPLAPKTRIGRLAFFPLFRHPEVFFGHGCTRSAEHCGGASSRSPLGHRHTN